MGELDGAHGVLGEIPDELSDSLRLEPDIELEPGVDLKADLGLAVADESVVAMSTTMAVPVEHESGVSAGGKADDLGFEMIDKDEAAGAALNAEGSERGTDRSPVDSAPVSGKAARKAWPWIWGRN